ncbi:hypothetical protein M8J76_010128 [Diaphorina citri]|nr:hypothetical protein M8J76_010128 [Diaphorina citri]
MSSFFSILTKPFACCVPGGSYEVFNSSSSCGTMSKLRSTVICVGVIVVSFVLISSFYLSDSDYRRKLADIKYPRVRVKRPDTCSYQACHPVKPDHINVHIIPHSHDDMGWLKTVEEYYTGGGDPKTPHSVRKIIGSTVAALNSNPDRRFIQVETGFFSMWWKEQNNATKEMVRKLVNTGRLEFTGGAWAMNDEATAHYASILDGFSLGLRLLNETFGRCGVPRVGWQIDPFGHSKEMASMFAQMGYEGFMFSRMDYQDLSKRQKEKGMQMLWEASADLGKSSHIFTEMINNVYNPPSGFCFDILCHIEFIDDETSSGYNAPYLAKEYLKWVQEQAAQFRSDNIPALFGGDFTYQEAEYYYRSLDKMIKYINNMQINGSKVNLLYSTPSCYIKAVHNSGITLPTKQDDFFPYGSGKHAYWTGFFTSRPALKRYERFGHNMLQVCKQLYVLSNLKSHSSHHHEDDLNVLREAMGVLQHHDGITGTAKQHPSNNYAELIHNGLAACEKVANDAFQNLMRPSGSSHGSHPVVSTVKTCLYLNISSCEPSETWDKFAINVYNALGRTVNRYVRIPVKQNVVYIVRDHTGTILPTQIAPIPDKVLQMAERTSQNSSAKMELVFKATLPPMGYSSFFMFGLRLDKDGLVSQLLKNNESLPMTQTFGYYVGHESDYGNNDNGEMSSGAYIFKPEVNKSVVSKSEVNDSTVEDVVRLLSNGEVTTTVYKGPLVEEVHQTYGQLDKSFVSQVIRLYKGEDHFEFEWLVGPIPTDDNLGKEIVTRYKIPSFNSQNRFYTDSNGREMIERILNYRQTWELDNQEPISSNYYPVTSRIAVVDDVLQMSVLTDRAQGGTSLRKGEIELMIHRRLLHDDGKGVDEPLDEKGVDGKGLTVRGKHWLTVGDRATQSALDKALSLEFLYQPWLFFVRVEPATTFPQWQNKVKLQYSGMNKMLPEGIHVLSLEPWTDGTILLRLEHTLEGKDHPELSKPASVNLYKLFQPFRINTIYEASLGANLWYQDVKRLQWKTDPDFLVHYNTSPDTSVDRTFVDVFNITLTPMMIRTFVISPFRINTIYEASLGANLWYQDVKRLQWKTDHDFLVHYNTSPDTSVDRTFVDVFNITLTPMMIRTFVISVSYNDQN